MELRDLTHEERLSLVALLEQVVESEGAVSEAEVAKIERVVAALGEDEYRRLVQEVDSRFIDEASLKKFLGGIDRQDARELIYGTVLETAAEHTVSTPESTVLDWLGKLWNVHVAFADDGSAGG